MLEVVCILSDDTCWIHGAREGEVERFILVVVLAIVGALWHPGRQAP